MTADNPYNGPGSMFNPAETVDASHAEQALREAANKLRDARRLSCLIAGERLNSLNAAILICHNAAISLACVATTYQARMGLGPKQ